MLLEFKPVVETCIKCTDLFFQDIFSPLVYCFFNFSPGPSWWSRLIYRVSKVTKLLPALGQLQLPFQFQTLETELYQSTPSH